ncbi:MAG: helicase-related protein, partial [Marinobacterium sp.]
QQPERIQVARRNATSQQVKQSAYAVTNADKTDVLCYLIQQGRWQQTLVFTRTKRRADQLTEELLEEGIAAVAIHGDRHQRERLAALQAFSNSEVQVLVATDVAARGLDIEALPQVVNYDLPNQPEAYVHRIGRTGRAGQKGWAVSLVAPEERRFLQQISALTGKSLQVQPVPRFENGRLIEGGALAENKTGKKARARTSAAPAQTSGKRQPDAPAKIDKPARSAGRRSLFSK